MLALIALQQLLQPLWSYPPFCFLCWPRIKIYCVMHLTVVIGQAEHLTSQTKPTRLNASIHHATPVTAQLRHGCLCLCVVLTTHLIFILIIMYTYIFVKISLLVIDRPLCCFRLLALADQPCAFLAFFKSRHNRPSARQRTLDYCNSKIPFLFLSSSSLFASKRASSRLCALHFGFG